MKSQKMENFEEKSSGKSTNYIETFRKNIDRLMAQHDYTIVELSEFADMSFSTLKNFLYDKEAKDCRLSTAIKLAEVFDVTIDELVGILDAKTARQLDSYRTLPKSSQALIDWYINNEVFIHSQHDKTKPITIMLPVCAHNGNLKKTSDYIHFDASVLDNELYHKVFFGIKIPCDHYLPHYRQNDILLIANDRNAMNNEDTVVLINDNIVITHRVSQDGIILYYGIRDKVLHAKDSKMAQVIGYIAKVINE